MPFFSRIKTAYAPLMDRIARRYAAIFSVHEIEEERMLQFFYGAMLFAFFVTFYDWIGQSFTTVHTASIGAAHCWAYFPDCARLYFLEGLPYGYSQSTFYMGIYALILLAVYCMWRSRWVLAHALMLFFFLWKVYVMFVLTSNIPGGPNYHQLLLVAALLFLPYKKYFVSLTFALEYFLAAVIKIDQTWVLGTYFTSLQTGLPLFGNALAPLFTNAVIFMQVVGSWFLMSRRRLLQRSAFFFFLTFHLYSAIFVGYTYPSLALSTLVVLFGPLYRPLKTPFSPRALIGWGFVLLLFAFELPGHLIVGDQRLTQEGNRFGLNLFDANHQCVENLTVRYTPKIPIPLSETRARPGKACNDLRCLTYSKNYMDGAVAVREERWESPIAWQRCNPHLYVTDAQIICKQPRVISVAMQFDHSIDGGPFYRIIDEKNICTVSYSTFSHNDWIKLPPEAKIVGYPVKNIYRNQNQGLSLPVTASQAATSSEHLIVLNELVGNDPIVPTPLQRFLTPYLSLITHAWSFVWVIALVLAVYFGWKRRT